MVTFYESFKSQAGVIVPVLSSGVILIGLNIYTLIKSDIPDETSKKIRYAELFFSFVLSSPILLFMSIVIYDSIKYGFIFKNPIGTLFGLLVPLLTPFGLTVIKGFIQNKEYVRYLSIPTTIITAYTMMYIFLFAFKGTLGMKRK